MVEQRFVRSRPDKSTLAAACSCATVVETTASIWITMSETVSTSGVPLLQEAKYLSENLQNTKAVNVLS